MKQIIIFVMMVLTLGTCLSAFADDNTHPTEFDWEAYSLEELLPIQENLNTVVLEKQRQWAIENGNRVIDLDVTEVTLYTTQTQAIVPTVTRVVDDAPESTRFVWKSSDESVARVNYVGTVTAVGMGDAEITCTAEDDEYIFSTATVHVVLPVTAVTVPEPRITLLLSEKPEEGEAALTANVAPENAYCQDITWLHQMKQLHPLMKTEK